MSSTTVFTIQIKMTEYFRSDIWGAVIDALLDLLRDPKHADKETVYKAMRASVELRVNSPPPCIVTTNYKRSVLMVWNSYEDDLVIEFPRSGPGIVTISEKEDACAK